MLFKLMLLPEGPLPPPLQLAGDQAVLGIDGLVLPLCMRGLVPSALEPLLPQIMASLPLGLQIGRRRQAQLQCRRLKRLQHQRRGQGIECLSQGFRM